MAHGFSAVKEMYLDRYAEAFAAAGIATLVFDRRGVRKGGHFDAYRRGLRRIVARRGGVVQPSPPAAT